MPSVRPWIVRYAPRDRAAGVSKIAALAFSSICERQQASKQETPRDQLSVARGGENVRGIAAYFGCSFSAAELMQ
jgi:hypothetical protein